MIFFPLTCSVYNYQFIIDYNQWNDACKICIECAKLLLIIFIFFVVVLYGSSITFQLEMSYPASYNTHITYTYKLNMGTYKCTSNTISIYNMRLTHAAEVLNIE